MSLKNVMVAQSGGPTVAINASLAGVIRGVMASDQYETVYGSVNGILGILNNHLLNLTEIMNENPAYLDRLETTPAMYFAAEPKPGVWSVSHRSLSIVFGMPIMRTSLPIFLPYSDNFKTVSIESFPPM